MASEVVISLLIKAKDQASGVLRGVAGSFQSIFNIAGGILSAQVFSRIAEAVGDIARTAWDAAASFQTLQIRMEGLIAREMVATGVETDFAEALSKTVKPANELLDWIKKTAVWSPFTVKDITRIQTLNMAMGMTTDRAKETTLAIQNFSAGMGLTGDVMDRIAYNFGQIIMQGKVAGTEVRDLARGAFVPVTDVLIRMRDNLGKSGESLDKFRKEAAKGKYDVQEFITAFIEIANEQFPNAAERMSKTWQGVTSNITDFVEVMFGAQLMGPIIEDLATALVTLVQAFMTDEMRAAMSDLGEAIADLITALIGMPDAETMAENFLLAIQALTEDIVTIKDAYKALNEGDYTQAFMMLGMTDVRAKQMADFILALQGISGYLDHISQIRGFDELTQAEFWTIDWLAFAPPDKVSQVIGTVLNFVGQCVMAFKTFLDYYEVNIKPRLQEFGLNIRVTASFFYELGRAAFWLMVTIFKPLILIVWTLIKGPLETLKNIFGAFLILYFQNAGDKLQRLIDLVRKLRDWFILLIAKLKDFADRLANLHIPGSILGNSPSPFELSLRGIASAMKDVNTSRMDFGNANTTNIDVTAQYPYRPYASLKNDVAALRLAYARA